MRWLRPRHCPAMAFVVWQTLATNWHKGVSTLFVIRCLARLFVTGRTNNLLRRQGEHFRDPRLSDFEFEIVARTDVYAQQRGLEQLLHDTHSPILNRINPIRATNPNRDLYLSEAEQFLVRYGGDG